jgi:hypothetical protein
MGLAHNESPYPVRINAIAALAEEVSVRRQAARSVEVGPAGEHGRLDVAVQASLRQSGRGEQRVAETHATRALPRLGGLCS